MKRMTTLPVKERTVVAGKPTVRTGTVELHAADAAHVVFRDVPPPYGCRGVVGYFDFHFGGWLWL